MRWLLTALVLAGCDKPVFPNRLPFGQVYERTVEGKLQTLTVTDTTITSPVGTLVVAKSEWTDAGFVGVDVARARLSRSGYGEEWVRVESCQGSLVISEAQVGVEFSGPARCASLAGTWSAKAKPKPAPVAGTLYDGGRTPGTGDECERYVACVCELASTSNSYELDQTCKDNRRALQGGRTVAAVCEGWLRTLRQSWHGDLPSACR